MITQRAYLLGVVAFCFYLIAIVNDLPPFYYLLTWLSVGILVSSLGIALLSLVGLSCSWRLVQTNVTESWPDAPETALLHGPRLEVELENSGTLNKTGVIIEAILRRAAARETDGQSTPAGAETARRFLLEALPSGESVRSELVLRDLRRGRYHLEELRLVGSDVLGLFRITRRIGAVEDEPRSAREMTVGPATVSWDGGVPEFFRQSSREGQGSSHRSGHSNDIRATRPYAPGDDLRHVHWKTTARRNSLVVKEFERSVERAPCLVVWDGASYAQWSDEDSSTAEWGLRLAASLRRALTENGLSCGVLRLDAAPLLLPFGEGAANVSGARVVELFADAAADRPNALSDAMQPFQAVLSPGLTIFLITASLSPDVARVARHLRASGQRVNITLINGAALWMPAAASLWRRAAGNAAVENWPRGASGAPAGNAPLTTEQYREQVQLLRSQGISTTLLPAAETESCAPALRQAMREMMSVPGSRL